MTPEQRARWRFRSEELAGAFSVDATRDVIADALGVAREAVELLELEDARTILILVEPGAPRGVFASGRMRFGVPGRRHLTDEIFVMSFPREELLRRMPITVGWCAVLAPRADLLLVEAAFRLGGEAGVAALYPTVK